MRAPRTRRDVACYSLPSSHLNLEYTTLQGETSEATPLQRYIAMLFRRILVPLRLQHGQRLNQFFPRISRLNDSVHKSAVCNNVRIRKPVPKLFNLFPPHLFAIRRRIEFALVNNVHRALRTHHRNLCRGPSEIHIGADVLRRHHAIRPAIRLACDYGNLRYSGFGEREQQLRPMLDDPAVLLSRPWQKSGHIFKRYQRNVEAITEAYKPRALH